MGCCSTVPEAVQDTRLFILQFEQTEQTLAANGGLVYRFPQTERIIPVGSIAYGSRFIYWNIRDGEFVETLRNTSG